ncbi:MAG: hypothetical protein L6Q71_11745, partial [Planctomycetes bacterium]|nr:hypothetical protein [Planctomycetota bacterium]
MPGQPSYPVLSTDSRLAARWLILALAAITIGGLFALGVLIARVPIFAEHIPASMSPLFERTLAVHVNLAFGVWFYCWLVVLFLQLPQNRDTGLIHRAIQWIAAIGVACFVAAIALPDAPMIKSNY